MKRFILIMALFPACLPADEAADRGGIQKVIAALSESRGDPGAARRYFASDADPREVERFFEVQREMTARALGPWSEVTKPRIVMGAILFVTQEVALVDGTISQFGSAFWRNVPVLFVMKKQGTEWRIAAVRVQLRAAAPAHTLRFVPAAGSAGEKCTARPLLAAPFVKKKPVANRTLYFFDRPPPNL